MADEVKILLLRSAPVAGVMRDKGWTGPARSAEAADLIERGWAIEADRTREGKKDAGGKRG